MPETTPAAGLHTPITNVPSTESTVVAPMLSPGSTGLGDEAAIERGALVEAVRPDHRLNATAEGGAEFVVPDLSGLEDIGVASFGTPAQIEQ
jgi:glutamyl endopeptidase